MVAWGFFVSLYLGCESGGVLYFTLLSLLSLPSFFSVSWQEESQVWLLQAPIPPLFRNGAQNELYGPEHQLVKLGGFPSKAEDKDVALSLG